MIQIDKLECSHNDIPSGYVALFFGFPKTHKTTEASKWSEKGQEGVLVIDTELGSDYVDGINRVVCTSLQPPLRPKLDKDGNPMLNKFGLPQEELIPPMDRGFTYITGAKKGTPMPVYSFGEILAYITDNVATFQYDTIVIDTIDELNDWIEQETCKKLNIESMGQGDFGSDWAISKNRIKLILTNLIKLLKKYNKNLILISHAKSSVVVKDVKQLRADLPKGVAKAIMGMCELIGHVTITKGDAKISFNPYEEVTMGSRIKALNNKTIDFNYIAFKNTITIFKEEK